MNNVITRDPDTGIVYEEVKPGAPDDPFAPKDQGTSPPLAASPADDGTGGVKTHGLVADGTVAGSQAASPTQPLTPEAASAAPVGEDDGLPKTQEDLKALIASQLEEARRTQQSVADKRIDALAKELKDTREASIKAEREAKLNSPDLSEDDRSALEKVWALDDREQKLNQREADVEDFFSKSYLVALAQDYGKFGVKAEDLDGKTPEEMDSFVHEKELTFYRNGGVAQTKTSAVAVKAEEPVKAEVPAGAQAPSDVAGGAPAAPQTPAVEGKGPDALAQAINNAPWETVRLPN